MERVIELALALQKLVDAAVLMQNMKAIRKVSSLEEKGRNFKSYRRAKKLLKRRICEYKQLAAGHQSKKCTKNIIRRLKEEYHV